MSTSCRGRGDRGATLLEFAVIAPLLFLLLFGVIEFARVIHGYTTVWNAAREGARYATTVGDTDSDDVPNYLDCASIEQASLSRVVGVDLDTNDIQVRYFDLDGNQVADCELSPPAPAAGGADIDNGFTIEVEATATFEAVVPLLSAFLDGLDLGSTQSRAIFKGVVGET